MTRKLLAQVSILILLLLAFFGTPASAHAGGVCGGTYYAESGDTLETIAQRCGTTVAAIKAANTGIVASLSTGQALFVPGPDYYCDCPLVNTNYTYTYTYTVQQGDTFALIANRFGVSIYELWAANPNIRDINVLYVGQVLYIPASNWIVPVQTWYPPPWYQPSSTWYPPDPSWFQPTDTISTPTPEHLSYGTAPGAPKGSVKLSNKTSGDVYVSLQGITADGITVINEYTVNGTMNVRVPAGKYEYVAWVGGKSYSGQFGLPKGAGRSITFYKDKVVAE